MTDLLPCPFCGRQPTSHDSFQHGDEGYYEVQCYGCSAGSSVERFVGVHADTEAEAVSAWNTRATGQLFDALNEIVRLRKALELLTDELPEELHTLDEPDEDWEVIVKMRAIARAALVPPADRGAP